MGGKYIEPVGSSTSPISTCVAPPPVVKGGKSLNG